MMKLQFSYRVENSKNEYGPIYIIHAEPYGDTAPLFLGIQIPPLSSVVSFSILSNLSVLACSLKECAIGYELGEFDDIIGFIDTEGKEIDVVPDYSTLRWL